MADARARPRYPDQVVVDANYVRDQAVRAVELFLAPLHGLVALAGFTKGTPTKNQVSKV